MGVRIQELPETTGIKKEDVLIVEDGQGTKKGTVQQLDETLGVSQLKEDLVYKASTIECNMGVGALPDILRNSIADGFVGVKELDDKIGYRILIEDGVVSFTTNGADSQYMRTCSYDVSEFDYMSILCNTNSSGQYGFVFTDSENKVIYKDFSKSSYELSVPKGATKLYVSRYAFLPEVKKYELVALVNENIFNKTISKIKELIPSYYFVDNYLSNKLSTINEKNRLRNGVTFNFITDIHYPRNTGISKLLLKMVCDKTSVKNTFFGGDNVYAYLTNNYTDCDTMMHDAGKFIQEYSNFLSNKFYQVKGNHDYTVATDSAMTTGTTLSNESIYEYVMRQTEETIHGVSGKFYFYVENELQKTRFIVIDMYEGETDTSKVWGLGHEISNEQYSWLCNDAMSKDGYKYIIFTHASTDSTLGGYDSVLEPVHSIMSAMNNKTTYVNEPLGINVDFTNTTSEVICNIAGHEHRDLYHTKDGVLTILTTCDAWLSDDGVNREPGTITEHAFDVFSIDYTNRTIKTTRIGAGSDREFTY